MDFPEYKDTLNKELKACRVPMLKTREARVHYEMNRFGMPREPVADARVIVTIYYEDAVEPLRRCGWTIEPPKGPEDGR